MSEDKNKLQLANWIYNNSMSHAVFSDFTNIPEGNTA